MMVKRIYEQRIVGRIKLKSEEICIVRIDNVERETGLGK